MSKITEKDLKYIESQMGSVWWSIFNNGIPKKYDQLTSSEKALVKHLYKEGIEND